MFVYPPCSWFLHTGRRKIVSARDPEGDTRVPALTGLSERDLRQQLKKSAKPMVFDGGSEGERCGRRY